MKLIGITVMNYTFPLMINDKKCVDYLVWEFEKQKYDTQRPIFTQGINNINLFFEIRINIP